MRTLSRTQIKKDILSFLKKNGIMTLATKSIKGPWACTVYYGVDDAMNLYIVTDPDSTHGKNMIKNCKVAFTIFDSHQKVDGLKRGIQGSGTIKVLKTREGISEALALWHKQNPGIEGRITADIVETSSDTKVFEIAPSYLKFYNKELYGHEEYGVWEAEPPAR